MYVRPRCAHWHEPRKFSISFHVAWPARAGSRRLGRAPGRQEGSVLQFPTPQRPNATLTTRPKQDSSKTTSQDSRELVELMYFPKASSRPPRRRTRLVTYGALGRRASRDDGPASADCLPYHALSRCYAACDDGSTGCGLFTVPLLVALLRGLRFLPRHRL